MPEMTTIASQTLNGERLMKEKICLSGRAGRIIPAIIMNIATVINSDLSIFLENPLILLFDSVKISTKTKNIKVSQVGCVITNNGMVYISRASKTVVNP